MKNTAHCTYISRKLELGRKQATLLELGYRVSVGQTAEHSNANATRRGQKKTGRTKRRANGNDAGKHGQGLARQKAARGLDCWAVNAVGKDNGG